MNVNKVLNVIFIALIICANLYALYAGLFDYAFSFWTLQEGETIDWSALSFYVIAFINIFYITIRLILKFINICQGLKRSHTFS